MARDGTLEDVRIVAEDAAGATARLAVDAGAAAANAAALAARAAAGGMLLLGRAVARAAEAAAEAGNAGFRQRVYDAAIETLDGVLRIGGQADPLDEAEVRRAIAVFEIARGDLTGLPDAA